LETQERGLCLAFLAESVETGDENYDRLLILCMFFTNNSYCLESFVNANPTYKDVERFQKGLVHKFDGLKSYM